MFTGLIETVGTIVSMEERTGARRITVEAPALAGRLNLGDSVAVSGVCLTALDLSPTFFHADLAAETIARTSLSLLKPGARVNLELPTPAGAPLGGHVVQGHVDATGELLSLKPIDPKADAKLTDWWLEIEVPEHIRQFVVEKGSIAIEGISLTVARWDGRVLGVAVIPHTYASTNLHTLAAGYPVNLEADVLMKLALQKQGQPAFELNVDYLVANGY